MTRKSRNFNGCWTCRSRKVKCDLQKPECNRCSKAGLECAGYNIILGWSNPLTISLKDSSLVYLNPNDDDKSDSFQRRNVELVKFPKAMRYETYKKLNESLEKLDDYLLRGNGNRFTVGPFSVYKFNEVEMRRVETFEEGQSLLDDHVPLSTRTIYQEAYASGQAFKLEGSEVLEDKPKGIFSKFDDTLLGYAKLTMLALKGINYKCDEQNVLHILYPKYFPNTDLDDWIVNLKVLDKLFSIDDHGLTLKVLFKELLNNFSSDIFTFIRVNNTSNYCDTILIPYINQITCELICHHFTSWNKFKFDEDVKNSSKDLKNHIKLGIIYSALALSAFKLSISVKNITTNDKTYYMDDYLKMSIELRKISVTIVNYHLDEYDNNYLLIDEKDFEYENLLLLCFILQIQTDIYFGVFENFELIFAIGDFIIKNKFKDQKLSDLSKLLVNMFKIISIFFESTHSVNLFNYSIADGDNKVNYRDLNENYDLISDAEDDNEEEDEQKDSKKDTQIKPTIKNLIITNEVNDNNTPLSFTVSFNKRNLADNDEEDPDVHQPLPKKSDSRIYIPEPKNYSTIVDINSIYLMHGIPKSLIDLFNEIIHLTNHKNIFKTKRLFPRNFPKICAEVEDSLLNWDLSKYWKLYEAEFNPVLNEVQKKFLSQFHQSLYHNVTYFHNGLIVYFNRLIKNSTLEHNQKYIDVSIDSLKKLLALNAESTFKFKPTFWTLLVCGSDLIDKHKQHELYALWKNSTISQTGYWRAKQILSEVWKRREIGEDYSWMDLVREWEIVLCLA